MEKCFKLLVLWVGDALVAGGFSSQKDYNAGLCCYFGHVWTPEHMVKQAVEKHDAQRESD